MLVAHFERIVRQNFGDQTAENNLAARVFRPDQIIFLVIMKRRIPRNFAGFGIGNGFKNAVVVINFHGKFKVGFAA